MKIHLCTTLLFCLLLGAQSLSRHHSHKHKRHHASSHSNTELEPHSFISINEDTPITASFPGPNGRSISIAADTQPQISTDSTHTSSASINSNPFPAASSVLESTAMTSISTSTSTLAECPPTCAAQPQICPVPCCPSPCTQNRPSVVLYNGEEEDLSPEQKETTTMEVALREIKQDIISKSNQIRDEKEWVDQVRKIVDNYRNKMNRVVTNIKEVRGDIQNLFKKKRQIENLMLQKKLETKLTDAKADLDTLEGALTHVKTKADSFLRNRDDVVHTIAAIKAQLSKLRGGSSANDPMGASVPLPPPGNSDASAMNDPNVS